MPRRHGLPHPRRRCPRTELHLNNTAEDGTEHLTFSGTIIDVAIKQEVWGSFSAVLQAVSDSWLIDHSRRNAHFGTSSLGAIANQLGASSAVPDKPFPAEYVQFGETNWDFLLRLADDHGAWVRAGLGGIEVSNTFDPPQDLIFRDVHGLLEFYSEGVLGPAKIEAAQYDAAAFTSQSWPGEQQAPTFESGGARMGAAVAGGSAQQALLGETSRSRSWTCAEMTQRALSEAERAQGAGVLAGGTSRLQTLTAGGAITVQNCKDADGTYYLLEVTHIWTRHPEKRHEVTEWMILVACAMGIVPALVGAVAGLAAAGVGSVVGGLAGDEAGAALRATCILLIEDGARTLEKVVEFLRRFIKGDVLRFLREVKFIHYAEPVAQEVSKFLRQMISITEKVIAKASSVTWIARVGHIVDDLKVLDKGFRELDEMAAKQIRSVMGEFDKRLTRALAEPMTQAEHVVHPDLPAPHPPAPPKHPPTRVVARADMPLGKPEGLEPPKPLPPKVEPTVNLHPQGVETEPSVSEEEIRSAKIAETKKKMRLRSDLPDSDFKDNGRLKWPDDDGALDGWHDQPLKRETLLIVGARRAADIHLLYRQM